MPDDTTKPTTADSTNAGDNDAAPERLAGSARVPGGVTDAEVNALPEPTAAQIAAAAAAAAGSAHRQPTQGRIRMFGFGPGRRTDSGADGEGRRGAGTDTGGHPRRAPAGARVISGVFSITGVLYFLLVALPLLNAPQADAAPSFDALAAIYGVTFQLLAIGIASSRNWYTYTVMAVVVLALLSLGPADIRSSFGLRQTALALREQEKVVGSLERTIEDQRATNAALREWLLEVLPDAQRYSGLREQDTTDLLDRARDRGLSIDELDELGMIADAIALNVDPDHYDKWLIDNYEALSRENEIRGEIIRAMWSYASTRHLIYWDRDTTQLSTFSNSLRYTSGELIEAFKAVGAEGDDDPFGGDDE